MGIRIECLLYGLLFVLAMNCLLRGSRGSSCTPFPKRRIRPGPGPDLTGSTACVVEMRGREGREGGGDDVEMNDVKCLIVILSNLE